MINKFKTAQYIIKNSAGMHGFNRRIYGETFNEAFGYPCAHDPSGWAGFELVEKMIMSGKIYFVHRFRHIKYRKGEEICKGYAFPYGGTYVCNTCNNSKLNRHWWKVKVYKDGTAWCCVGEGFEDLQKSDNYAFGETREESLEKYEVLMFERDALENGERL
jgi:hypothetical protein